MTQVLQGESRGMKSPVFDGARVVVEGRGRGLGGGT